MRMLLNNARLKNFRSYQELQIEFVPGIQIIRGPNGIGKTNIVEALFFMSTGRSFRTSSLTDMVREGEGYFYIEMGFEKDLADQTLKIGISAQQKNIQYNTTELPYLSHILGIFPSVLLSPKDINLIMGTPSDRRRFLNIHLAQSDPLYLHHLMRYSAALKQRNALLKAKKTAGIEAWEHQLSSSAKYLIHARDTFIKTLPLQEYAQKVCNDHFEIKYHPSHAHSFEKHRAKELILGTTLIGPHRDDFDLLYEGKEAKAFASEGQKRSCITALKLAQWKALADAVHAFPLLSIDDFDVHLDPVKVDRLSEVLHTIPQVILTTPSSTDRPERAGILLDPTSQILSFSGRDR